MENQTNSDIAKNFMKQFGSKPIVTTVDCIFGNVFIDLQCLRTALSDELFASKCFATKRRFVNMCEIHVNTYSILFDDLTRAQRDRTFPLKVEIDLSLTTTLIRVINNILRGSGSTTIKEVDSNQSTWNLAFDALKKCHKLLVEQMPNESSNVIKIKTKTNGQKSN